MVRGSKRARRSIHDSREHRRNVYNVGRYDYVEYHREKRVNKLYRMLTSRDYRILFKYLGLREAFMYSFLTFMHERIHLPERFERIIHDKIEQYHRLAIQRFFDRLKKRLSIKKIVHPYKVIVEMSYSDLQELTSLARLAWLNKAIDIAPLNATLIKHGWCNSSRIFIRWDGSRGKMRMYIANNVVKEPDISTSPATPDHENITLPLINIWVLKYEDDWTSIINAMLEEIGDLAQDRAVITRNGKNEPVHTVPMILAIYTDYPKMIRSIVMGMTEITDTTYHCSAYYMPLTGRNLTNVRKNRIYEAKIRRRYRRMEGWI